MSDYSAISIWSGFKDEGGVRLAEVRDVRAFTDRWSVDAGWSCSLEIGAADQSVPFLVGRNVVYVESANEVDREYRIAKVTDGRRGEEADVVAIEGQDPALDLADRTMLREVGAGGVVYFDGGAIDLTAAEYLDTYAVPEAIARGIAVARGTVASALTLSISWARATVLAFIHQLVDAITAKGGDAEFDYVPDPGNGYVIELPAQIGSGATLPELHVGRHIARWERTRATADQASRVMPFGDVDASGYAATIGHAAWEVSAIPDATHIRVVDPLGGPGPVQFDGQAAPPEGHWYIQVPSTGALVEVTDSVKISATVSELEIADSSDFTVGDVFEFRADDQGTLLTSLVHPVLIQAPPTGIGEKLLPLERPELRGERNLEGNWDMSAWTTATDPPDGYAIDGSRPTPNIQQITDPTLVVFGGKGLRIQPGGGSHGSFGIRAPVFYFWPVAGGDLLTITVTVRVLTDLTLPGASGFALVLQTDAGVDVSRTLIPITSLKSNERVDLSIAGITVTASAGGALRVALQGDGSGGSIDFIWDAVQVVAAPAPAEAYFTGPRANALWQYGNAYLIDFGDPAPDFQVDVLDLARIDSAAWAHVAIARGATVRLVDPERSLDWQLRAIQLERNRLIAGATQITFSQGRSETKRILARSAAVVASPIGPSTAGSPTTPAIPPSAVVPTIPIQPATLIGSFRAGDPDVTLPGESPWTIAAFPSAETLLATTRAYLYGYPWLRVQATIKTAGPVGSQLALRWSDDAGATWHDFDGAGGPFMAADQSAGEIMLVGDDVAIAQAQQTDLLFGLFALGGDDASAAEFGNVEWHAHTGVQLLNPVSGCGLHADAFMGDDYEGRVGGAGSPYLPDYADFAEFWADWLDNTTGCTSMAYCSIPDDSSVSDFDAAETFAGHRSWVGSFGVGSYGGNGNAWLYSDNNYPSEAAITLDDVWHRLTLKVEAGYATTGRGTGSHRGDGYLELLGVIAQYPGVGTTAWAGVALDGGRLMLYAWDGNTYPFSGLPAEVDLGADTLLVGQSDWKDLILHLEALDNNTYPTPSTWRATVYLVDACGARGTELGHLDFDRYNFLGLSMWTSGYTLNDLDYNTPANATPKKVWLGKWEFVKSSNNPDPYA